MELRPYIPILILFVIAVTAGVGTVIISGLFGPKRHHRLKEQTYECGVLPADSSRRHVSVKYYLVAVLFILFDVETVYLIPWAVIFRDALVTPAAAFVLLTMLGFVAVLVLGLVYVFQKKVLDWNR